MNIELKNKIDNRLQRIANVLMLNASFTDNLGLLNGKMGIAIFFYHYARYTEKDIYEEYAGQLIDEIYEEISNVSPIDFFNGVTGIGWGIEYMAKCGFIEPDTDEALEDIDCAVMNNCTQRPVLVNNKDDLFGHGLYFMSRLIGKTLDEDAIPMLTKKQTIIYLVDECERLLIHKRFLDFQIPEMSTATINSILCFLQEVYKMKLFPSKVEKLLYYMNSNFTLSLNNSDNYTDNETLVQLMRKANELVNNVESRNQLQRIIQDYSIEIPSDNKTVILEVSKMNWHSILYKVGFESNNSNNLKQKAIDILLDDTFWAETLDTLTKDNLGVNNGLSGFGLSLMNEGKRIENILKQESTLQFQTVQN